MADSSLFHARGNFIDGRFSLPENPDAEIALEDPGDVTSLVGSFPFSRKAAADAIAAACRAYPAWRDTSSETRANLLRSFAAKLGEASETLAELIARDAGKPLWEARAEVKTMVDKVEITLEQGLHEIRERRFELGEKKIARWRAHARGVLVVLGPFNFPGHLVHGHVVPALATGNTVVIKPSEQTPVVGQLYAEIAARAGFPPGVLNLVQGDATVGAELSAHPDAAGVLFTGSYAVGRRILEATLDQPWKIVALEMGGKNGVVVCEDADLDAAASAIAFGATATAGQRCSSTSRVISLRKVAEPLLKRLSKLLDAIRIGYELDDDVFMGPLISATAQERHAEVLRWARAENAEELVAGGPFEGPRSGHYVRPSLHRVSELDRQSRYQCEEHFVPDLCLLEVDSLEQAIYTLNASDYGLVGSIFTQDPTSFEYAYRESRLGLLNWNTSTAGASSKLPFGGLGKSGNNRPAAVLSTTYCSYPVASLELEQPAEPARYPGFPLLS